MGKDFYIDGFTGHFVLDGEHYIIGKTVYKKIGKVKHIDKRLMEKVEPKREEEILNEIARKIKHGLNVEKIIREAMRKQLGSGQREELLKLLQGKKAKVKEHNGCYGIEIKGKYFQLFD